MASTVGLDHRYCLLAGRHPCRAVLKMPEVEERSRDACAQVGARPASASATPAGPTCIAHGHRRTWAFICLGEEVVRLVLMGR